MGQVRWTPQAADDLEAICVHCSGRSASSGNVRRPSHRRHRSTGRLSTIGQVVPELEIENIREIIVGSYRVIYRIRQEEVHILTLHHGARLLDPKKIEAAA